tara:strand:+ start:3268 stop:5208 length:1941 start_codon:yes stop_codon:yes gene_type:complete
MLTIKNRLARLDFGYLAKIIIIFLAILLFIQIFLTNNYVSSNSILDVEYCTAISEINNVIENKEKIEITGIDLPVIPEFQNLQCLNKIYNISIDKGITYIILAQNKVIYSFIFSFLFLLNFLFFLFFKEKLYINVFLLLAVNFYVFLVAENTMLEIFLLFLLFFIPLLVDEKTIDNLNLKFVLIFVLFLSFFLQQIYLSKELITWDISTYLSMGQDINRGNLPYESQYSLKAVLCFYIFSIIDLISDGDYRIVKILNDLPILVLTIIMFFTMQLKGKKVNTIAAILLYTSFLSIEYYGATAYTEHFTLIPVALAFYIMEQKKETNYYIIGFLFSIATLINHGSVVMFFAALIYILFNNKEYFKNFLIGFSLPHFFFLFIYFINDLLNIYITANLLIPLNYTGLPFSEKVLEMFNGLIGFFSGLSSYNLLLFISAVFVSLFILYLALINLSKKSVKNEFLTIHYFFISCLIHLFFVGPAPVRHNFIIYFLCLYIVNIDLNLSRKIFLPLVLITSLSIFYYSQDDSIENIRNFDALEKNYGMHQVADDLKKNYNIDSSSSILALDHQLILYYLNAPNASYVNHPGMVFVNEVNVFDNPNNETKQQVFEELMLVNPDIVICNKNLYDFCIEINNYRLINQDYDIFIKEN